MDYCKEKREYHNYWRTVNVSLLPLSFLSWAIPGFLNVPCYWNVYRLFCQWYTTLVADCLISSVSKTPIQRKDILTSEIEFLEDSQLGKIFDNTESGSDSDSDEIENISELYNLDKKAIENERNHILNPPSWKITADDLKNYFDKIKNRKSLKKE